MGEVKETNSTVYETTDGKTFLIEAEAKKHQEYLNKPKVYILYYRDGSIEETYELETTARTRMDKLNKENDGSSYYIEEHILIKG